MRKINQVIAKGVSIILLMVSSATLQYATAQTSPKRLLGTFILKNKAYNYEFTMESLDNYSFLISTITDAEQDAPKQPGDSAAAVAASPEADTGAPADTEAPADTTTNKDNTSTQYIFREFSKAVFQNVFFDQMKNKYGVSRDSSVAEVASEVFFRIKARLDFLDDEPVTAYFILKKDYINSLLKSNLSNWYNGPLSSLVAKHDIHRVDVETDDGTIKNISVQLVRPSEAKGLNNSPRRFLLFKNQFPISVSGKFDYEKFSKINLYCYNCSGIDRLVRYIKLSDLAILDIVYENNKEDYSPSNRIFSVTPTNPIFELKKERRSQLIEIAAFTDFVGLDRSEPNGLIQVEAKRRININTIHRLLYRGKPDLLSQIDLNEVEKFEKPEVRGHKIIYRFAFKESSQSKIVASGSQLNASGSAGASRKPDSVIVINKPFRPTYFSFLSYIEPRLLFSKLEENQRLVDSAKVPGNKIDAVALYQYQLASFGVNVQVFRCSFPQWKVQWNVANFGAYWARTRVALSTDSAGPSTPLNIRYFDINSNLVFRPDSRYGVSVGFSYLTAGLWNNDYKLTNRKGIFQNQFDAFMKTSEEGKLFFRFRWTHENKNKNNNFTQIQLGYSVNLFAGTGNKPAEGQ